YMCGKITRCIKRRFLSVAHRNGTDTGFTDFCLERNFYAFLLQPHIEFLETAACLYTHYLTAFCIFFKTKHFIELTQANEGTAVINEGVGEGKHRTNRIHR